MSEESTFLWNREGGQPWESVEALPLPLDAASHTSFPPPWEQTTYDGPYYEGLPADAEDLRQDDEPVTPRVPRRDGRPWESLESCPPPLDEVSNHELPSVKDEDEGEDAEEIPRSPITPRAQTRPKIISSVPPLYDMGYVDPPRFPAILSPTKRGYPGYPAYPKPPGLRRRPGPLAIEGRRGESRRSHSPAGHSRTPGHPPVIPLSTLVEQLGISDPIHSSRRRRRPRSLLSPPPRRPTREEFVIGDISYEVREDRLYGHGGEVVFPKPPRYLPPIKKHSSPLHGRLTHDPRPIYGGLLRPAYPVPLDGMGRIPKGGNIWSVMNEMERSGQGVKEKKKGSSRRSGRSRKSAYGGMGWERWNNSYGGRYYQAGGGERKKAEIGDDGSGEEPDTREGKDRSKVQFSDHDTDYTSGPVADRRSNDDYGGAEWTDVDDHIDHDSGRGRRRRRSIDGSKVNVYESSHYHPDEARPFNVKRVRDKALKVFGPPKSSKGKDKAKASTSPDDPDGAADGNLEDDIYGVSDVEAKPKKVGPYEAFKKTTGKHPKQFHINPHSEAVERFVLDRRPLEEGEEDGVGKGKGRDRRRPMIDVVNVKTGKRTRKKIKGYDKLPTLIKVAAGVEMLNGRLPPRRRREVEEVEDADDAEEGEAGEEAAATKPRRRKGKGGRKKEKDCAVM